MSDQTKNITIRVAFPFTDVRVWQRFVIGLRSENRFSLADEAAKFVELLIEYGRKHKTITLPRDTSLYRARINESKSKDPFPLDRMGAPPANLAGHGRLNPKGIPYLYLASDEITAISEVRPWIGCDITVAKFSLVDDCEVVNFSNKHYVNVPEGEQFEGPEFTWRELIAWMFSAPFDPRDDTEYVPTQYLAERIKGSGFAGIIYDSSLSAGGYNVTLFDVTKAKAVCRQVARVTGAKVDAEFQEIREN